MIQVLGERPYPVLVLLENSGAVSGCHIPDPDRFVGTAANQASPISIEQK